MPDDTLPERIRLNAAAVRVALDPDTPARIARAVTPTLARLEAEKLALPMEVEPSTFTVVQRKEIPA
jgi:hypothetical protein